MSAVATYDRSPKNRGQPSCTPPSSHPGIAIQQTCPYHHVTAGCAIGRPFISVRAVRPCVSCLRRFGSNFDRYIWDNYITSRESLQKYKEVLFCCFVRSGEHGMVKYCCISSKSRFQHGLWRSAPFNLWDSLLTSWLAFISVLLLM